MTHFATGIDVLGALHRKFPINTFIKVFKGFENLAVGSLADTTFGDSLDPLQRILDELKPKATRLHLLNNTAVRNNKLGPTELLNGYTLNKINTEIKNGGRIYKIIEKQLSRVHRLKNTGHLCICPLLEDNLDGVAQVRLHAWLEKAFDFGEAVYNPLNRNYDKLNSVLYEKHGNRRGKADIRSNDGASLFDADFYSKEHAYYDAALAILFGWWGELNLRRSGANPQENPDKDRFVMPRLRGEYVPTEYQFRLARAVLTKPQTQPRIPGVRTLKDPEVWKPHADNNKDRKSFLGVLIIKSSKPSITLLSTDGRRLGTLKNLGRFHNTDRNRFYLGEGSGGTNLDLLEKNNGKEWVIADLGREKVTINLIRRCGLQRDE